jgi:recombinational DNA repair protein (RecF pathway)
MEEYVSDAIVLKKEPSGEFDARYALFTKRFGKISGKTTSSRKITSKLAGHLEPGTFAKVRFVEKGGVQIVDALKIARTDIAPADLAALNALLPEMQAEDELWEKLVKSPFSWTVILRTLGWGPKGAICSACHHRPATSFFIPQQEFFCDVCSSKLRANAVSLIRNLSQK